MPDSSTTPASPGPGPGAPPMSAVAMQAPSL